MIWLTWRQHRGQILTTAGFLLAYGALLLVSSIGKSRVRECAASAVDACPWFTAGSTELYLLAEHSYGWISLLIPALIGAFWGAPLLAREFERGTDQLAWTQAVPPRRWLLTKLGVLGGLLMLGGLALSAMASAWYAAFTPARGGKWFSDLGVFHMVGVAPAFWWLFAFALGTASGALLRKMLPAMAVTVTGIVLAVYSLQSLSDHYAEPVRVMVEERMDHFQDVRWVGDAWVALSGAETESPPLDVCPDGPDVRPVGGVDGQAHCLLEKGYRFASYLHPPSRFWRFQWTEAGILLAGSALLFGFTVARTVRRTR
ncbi:hypothetical protein [Rhizohabitans arisaemae]|uniref:hypothetical protein n=1 Tax=Rhizohabitans arisaemae TaxID=2720610 RepID=UPI0024B09682|nr:hypothetical protein [Rhizohabitans arisaemae]